MKNILIHGLGQDGKNWNIVKETLKENHLEVDTTNLFHLVKERLLRYQNLYSYFEIKMNSYNTKLNLCSLSLGGILALDYTKKNPEKLNFLILIGVPYQIPKVLFQLQTFVFKLLPKSKFEKLGSSKEDFIRLLDSMKYLRINENLDKIHCKTFILYGEKDKINMKSAKLFHNHIKNSELQIIKNAGHEVNKETPQELAEHILDFWKRIIQERIRR